MSGRHAKSDRIRLPGSGFAAALAALGLVGPLLVLHDQAAEVLGRTPAPAITPDQPPTTT